jgi:DNA-binding PadR family transcriptional regulator
MNLTRLMVLGTLARHGPKHGHEIRRTAEVTNVGEWGGVSVGALYRELRVMEGEGLVEPVRTEQVGRRPARTVYAITPEGHLELSMLREQAIRKVSWGPDPLGVALSFSGRTADREELTSWLRNRREIFAISATQLAEERQRLEAKGYLGPIEATVMRRAELHAESEVRWHDEFAQVLAGMTGHGGAENGPGPASAGPDAASPPADGNSRAGGSRAR